MKPKDRRPPVNAEFRADPETGVIRGYAALFNTPTELWGFNERIAPGAFTKTLNDGADVRALFNHDPNYVLGRTTAGTLKLWEDERGLMYEIAPQDTGVGKDIVASIKRGDVTQSSFGFYIEKEEWEYKDGEPDMRVIKEARLFDVSPVTFPAYEETTVYARSAVVENRAGEQRTVEDIVETWKATAAQCESRTDSVDERTTPGPEPDATAATHSGAGQEPDAVKRTLDKEARLAMLRERKLTEVLRNGA